MTHHDQARKDALVKTLAKAKEQAETMRLYLTVNDRDPADSYAANDALEHVENALERLGALVPSHE